MTRARALFVGLALAASWGAAAQMFGSGAGMPSLWYNPALMMDPAVQKELHVSPAVAQKAVQAMFQEAMKMGPAMMGMMGGQQPTPQQMKEAVATLDRMQKESLKDLTPAQKARLHEITLQSYGAKALLDPKVGAQIGLSVSQTSALQSALSKIALNQAAAVKSSMSGHKGFDISGMQGAASKSHAQSAAVLDAVLTPKQKAKWKALQGAPVKLGPLSSMMGG